MTAEHPHPDTVAVRAGREGNGTALAPTLWPTTVWRAPSLAEARRMATGVRAEGFYSRYANPTVRAFEDAVAELEGAEASLAFGSGMGAIAGVVMALCTSGSHVVAQQQLYAGTTLFLKGVCPRFGIDVTFVDATEPGALAAAVQPGRTMLVIAETPANPQLALTDLRALGAIRGPFTMVDGTFAPPVLQRPLDFGVHLVMHSATKGLAGHNDATLGVVSGAKDLLDEIWGYAVLHGAVASPFDSWNGLRGIRTLAVRTERQCATALDLAAWLEEQTGVAAVRHPFLASHPQHHLARAQMRAGGSMISLELEGGVEAGARFVEALRVAEHATSLGGPETLVTHPASTTHAGLTARERLEAGIADGLVRISVGLEHVEDLRDDFDRALRAAQEPSS